MRDPTLPSQGDWIQKDTYILTVWISQKTSNHILTLFIFTTYIRHRTRGIPNPRSLVLPNELWPPLESKRTSKSVVRLHGPKSPTCHGGASTPNRRPRPPSPSTDPSPQRRLGERYPGCASRSALSHAHTVPPRPLYPPTSFREGCPRRRCRWRNCTAILVSKTTRLSDGCDYSKRGKSNLKPPALMVQIVKTGPVVVDEAERIPGEYVAAVIAEGFDRGE